MTPPKAGFRATEAARQAEGMSWGRTITLSVVAIALTSTLVSCSAAANTLSELAAATPTATATPDALEGDLNGDGKLTTFETDWLAKTKADAAVRDYTLTDGTVIQVDPSQTLPEQVRNDIVAQFAEDIAVTTSTVEGGVRDARRQVMIDRVNQVKAATGRDVMVVYPSLSLSSSDARKTDTQMVWSSMNSAPEDGNPFAGPDYDVDRDAYIAKATEIAGDQYDVIVLG